MYPGVNLIPEGRLFAQQRRQRMCRWIKVGSGWGTIVLFACVATHLAWGRGYSAVADELQQTGKKIGDLNTTVTELRRKLAETEAARRTALSISDQPDWSILLSILGSTLGDDVTLREIHLAPEPQRPRQFLLKLHGFARSQQGVSQFVLRLQENTLFDEVKLVRTGREPIFNVSAVTFEISCTLGEGGKRQP